MQTIRSVQRLAEVQTLRPLVKVYQDFRGGLNTDAAPDNLADNELMTADNCDLDEHGAVSRRRGTRPLCYSGTAPAQTGMAATQIKFADDASADDDYYNTWILLIVGGTGAGQKRAINDYNGTTKIATVNEAWSTQPDNASEYEVIPFYSAQVERLIAWPRNDGTETLLAVFSSGEPAYTLQKIGDDGKATQVCALNSIDIGFFFYRDCFCFTDGSQYRVYDGTNVQLMLPTDTPAALLAAAGAAGNPNGTYKYKVTFANSLGQEGPLGAEMTITVTNQKVELSNIPTLAGSYKRHIYRTTAGGGSTFKLLAELGTDEVSYLDDTADADLGADYVEQPADNDLEPIARCRLLLWHPKSFRVFAAGDSSDGPALYYSEANNPGYFKDVNVLYPTTADGPVYGIASFGEAMIAKYQGSDWAWKGTDPASDAEWTKLPSDQGTVSSRTIRLTPNSLTFLGQGGIISLSPGLVDYSIVLLTGDELVKNRAKNKVTNIIRSISNRSIACAVYDKTSERYLLAYTDTPGGARNNKALVLDWGLQAFTVYNGWAVNDFTQRANGDVLFGTNGYIVKIGQGYKDWDETAGDYKPISYVFEPKPWNLDYPFNEKRNKYFLLAAKQPKAESSGIDELTITSGYKSVKFSDISLDESFVWGKQWGLKWGWTDLVTKKMDCRLVGARFQVRVEDNRIGEALTIYGFAFEFITDKPRGGKVS